MSLYAITNINECTTYLPSKPNVRMLSCVRQFSVKKLDDIFVWIYRINVA